VLFSVEPSATATIENDALIHTWGSWSRRRVARPDSRSVVVGGEPVVAALPGPVAVPGRWFDDDRRLRIAPEVVGLAGLQGRFPISIVRDEYQAPGPAAKEGTLLRGEGALLRGHAGAIAVKLERAVSWDGVETSSHRIRSSMGR
jgi:hypothetical protein